MRERLLNVLSHAHVTIFTVDRGAKVNMLEGALIWDADDRISNDSDSMDCWYMGQTVQHVFQRLSRQKETKTAPFLQPIDDILKRRRTGEVTEHTLGRSKPPFLSHGTKYLLFLRREVVPNSVLAHLEEWQGRREGAATY